MGDRANICIVQHPHGNKPVDTLIYLYTHWGGSEAPETLRQALLIARDDERGNRLDDEPYLARIIFQEMLDGDGSTTGYGTSSYLRDNEYSLLVVDSKRQIIWTANEDKPFEPLAQWSFDEYMALPEVFWGMLDPKAVPM